MISAKKFFPATSIEYGQEGLRLRANFDSSIIPVPDKSGNPLSESVYVGNTYFVQYSPWGLAMEFNGISDRLYWPVLSNPHLEIAADEVFTVFCLFRMVSYPTGIYGRVASKFIGTTDGVTWNANSTGDVISIMKSGLVTMNNTLLTGSDTDFHVFTQGFDGSTWFQTIDETRYENGVNSHNGFALGEHWSIGAKADGTSPVHCQVTEFGISRSPALKLIVKSGGTMGTGGYVL